MSNYSLKIILTGASGVLGRHLVRRLTKSSVSLQILTSRDSDAAKYAQLPPEHIHCLNELEENPGIIAPGSTIIHAGFARTPNGDGLASSIDFTQRLFSVAVCQKAAGIINISSQSVYSPTRQHPAEESDLPAPTDLYGMAKFACERIGESIAAGSQTKFTNLRLGSLISPDYPERLLSKFIARLLKRQNLKIVGGKQIFSLLDVRDAAEAIITFSHIPPEKWQNCYNLGNPKSLSIIELANKAAAAVQRVTDFKANIELEPGEVMLNSSLNTDQFYALTKWLPSYELDDTINTIISSMKFEET